MTDDAIDWLDVELRHAGNEPPRLFICPACRKKRGVDIIFGMPTEEMWEDEQRGEIVLGGCCPPLIGEPERQCLDCHHQWAIKRRKPEATSTT